MHLVCGFLLAAGLVGFGAGAAQAQEPEPEPMRSAPLNLVSDLAETLGRAHAIRTACNGDQDGTWRDYMLRMMALEAPSGPRRATLTDAFNRGYRSQSRETSSCTASATSVEASIARRGMEISNAIARSYVE